MEFLVTNIGAQQGNDNATITLQQVDTEPGSPTATLTLYAPLDGIKYEVGKTYTLDLKVAKKS